MKCLEVTDVDCKMAAQMVNMLQSGQWDVNGKDICASADTIRWIQKLAVSIGQGYQQRVTQDTSPPEAKEMKEEAKPSGGLPEGVQIKAYNPGKPSKK
jgi:carboxypeptidase C (cathepsin A)